MLCDRSLRIRCWLSSISGLQLSRSVFGTQLCPIARWQYALRSDGDFECTPDDVFDLDASGTGFIRDAPHVRLEACVLLLHDGALVIVYRPNRPKRGHESGRFCRAKPSYDPSVLVCRALD